MIILPMLLGPGSCAESWCSILECVPQTHAKEDTLPWSVSSIGGDLARFSVGPGVIEKMKFVLSHTFHACSVLDHTVERGKDLLSLRSHSLTPVTLQSFSYHLQHWSEWILLCIYIIFFSGRAVSYIQFVSLINRLLTIFNWRQSKSFMQHSAVLFKTLFERYTPQFKKK